MRAYRGDDFGAITEGDIVLQEQEARSHQLIQAFCETLPELAVPPPPFQPSEDEPQRPFSSAIRQVSISGCRFTSDSLHIDSFDKSSGRTKLFAWRSL